MLVAAVMGAIFSLLLSFASVNLRADQTIGGMALNLTIRDFKPEPRIKKTEETEQE